MEHRVHCCTRIGDVVAGKARPTCYQRLAIWPALCVFRELRRLIVDKSYGKLAVYHTGDLQISGICPNSSRAMSLTFYSQDGLVDIDELRQLQLMTVAASAQRRAR